MEPFRGSTSSSKEIPGLSSACLALRSGSAFAYAVVMPSGFSDRRKAAAIWENRGM